MKVLFELFPVLLFYVAYEFGDIYVATGVAIAATIGQVIYTWMRHGRVGAMLWVSFGLIVVFGGATLLLRDKTFIQIKPTVLYWLFTLILVVSDWVLRKNLLQAFLEMQGPFGLTRRAWTLLNVGWAAFFAGLGLLNLYVAFHFSESLWVKFKLFGTSALIMLAFVVTGLVLWRLAPEAPAGAPAGPDADHKEEGR